MKKKNFVSLLFGTVGGILFALGMCMCLLPEWGAFTPGVVIAAVGAAVLLVLLLVRRKMAGKPAVHISGKAVGAVLLGIVGALVLGVGSPSRCGRGHHLCGEVSKTGNQKRLRRNFSWQSQSWYRPTRKSPKALWTATRR